MYLVPLLIFVMFSNSVDQASGGGNGGGGEKGEGIRGQQGWWGRRGRALGGNVEGEGACHRSVLFTFCAPSVLVKKYM